MSLTISLEQASTQLSGLVRALGPNDVIVLTDNDKPVARIVADHKLPIQRQAGKWKGILEIVDEGEDEILDIFKDYMP